MNLDHLLSLVRRPDTLEARHTADLEALVKEYPYFTAGQFLLLKAYKLQNSIHFKKQLRKVSAMAPDRSQVYLLTEEWPEVESLEVTETGEKVAPSAENAETTAAQTEAVKAEVPQAETAAAEDALPTQVVALAEMVNEGADAPEAAAETTEIEWQEDVLAEQSNHPEEAQVETAPSTVFSHAEAAVEADALADDEALEVTAVPTFEAAEPSSATPTTEMPEEAEAEPMVELEDASASITAENAESEAATEAEEIAVFATDQEATVVPAVDEHEEASVMASEVPAAREISTDDAEFIKQPHDRLSWFRFFAGKPLREQPDEVLEQLYLEHMQQDLLQAPADTAGMPSLKAQINKAEEVASSREMEEEIKRLAYDSISDDELPASETLARIYEQQQEYKRAIKIYQKLILKFPDKMTYFAGLIEALRQK